MASRYIPTPTGITRFVTDGDVEIVSALQRHGLLNTHQLSKLVSYYKSIDTLRDRLQILFSDPIHAYGGQLLTRPKGQTQSIRALSKFIVHQKSIYADELLKERGIYEPRAITPTSPFLHQLFVSTITYSLEKGAKEHDLTFVPQYEVLNRADTDVGIEIPNMGKLTPDALVALEQDGKRLYLFIEADKGTEPHVARGTRKHTLKNVKQYQELIERGLYKEKYGIRSGAILLYLTINTIRMKNVLNIVDNHFPKGCTYNLHGTASGFADLATVPNEIPVYEMYWERASNAPLKLPDFFK